MCVDIVSTSNNNNFSMDLMKKRRVNSKVSYSVKKLLRQLFKQNTQQNAINNREEQLAMAQNEANSQQVESIKSLESLDSLESIENMKNSGLETESFLTYESYENEANERLDFHNEECEGSEVITVPVHFVRTACGTYFWTAASTYGKQDRWAQA